MDNPCKWLDDALWDNITELDKLVCVYSLMGNKLNRRDCNVLLVTDIESPGMICLLLYQ